MKYAKFFDANKVPLNLTRFFTEKTNKGFVLEKTPNVLHLGIIGRDSKRFPKIS